MKRKEPESVGDVLRNLLEEESLQARMEELKAIDLWPRIIGAELATQCSRPLVKEGVMRIGVPNASLRNELHLNRTKLKDTINSTLKNLIIKEIKFTS